MLIVPDGPAAAFSGSTWIHWWSSVASANRSICCCVTVCQGLYPRCVPTAFSSSPMPLKTFMGAPVPVGLGEGGGAPRSVARAARDIEDLAGDEAGPLTGEERHRVGDVLGPAGAAEWDLRGDGGLELLERHAH